MTAADLLLLLSRYKSILISNCSGGGGGWVGWWGGGGGLGIASLENQTTPFCSTGSTGGSSLVLETLD